MQDLIPMERVSNAEDRQAQMKTAQVTFSCCLDYLGPMLFSIHISHITT